MLLLQLSLCNRHETAQSRFRSQQIVVTRVPPALPDVVADSQQMTALVEQEIVFRTGEMTGLTCQSFDDGGRRIKLVENAASCPAGSASSSSSSSSSA